MNSQPTHISDKVFLSLIAAYLISMLYSKFLLSICLIILTLWSIFKFFRGTDQLGDFIKNRFFLFYWLFFALFFFSGVYSDNISEWMHQVKLKIPFLLFPFVFFNFREAFNHHKNLIYKFFVGLMILSSFFVLIPYFCDFENITKSIGKGQSIPTPIDHIKYSLFVAFAALIAFIYLMHYKLKHSEKLAIIFAGGFLFIYLHILAVRSGLVVFYLCFGLLLIYSAYIKIEYRKYFLAAMISMMLFPIIAIKTIPSLERKWGYMKYDLEMYMKGEGKLYSDSERLYSYQVAWDLFLENPILGTGFGDLLDACKEKYLQNYGYDFQKYPHNMYLFLLAGGGIIGLAIGLIFFLYPLKNFKSFDLFYLSFIMLMLVSFLVENTIQRSYSTAFFLFFSLLGIVKLYDQDSNKKGHPKLNDL